MKIPFRNSFFKKLFAKKTFVKGLEKNKPLKRKEQIVIEKLLLSRLKILGLVLLLFGTCFFLYGLKNPPTSPMEDGVLSPHEQELSSGFPELDSETNPEEALNFLSIGTLFFALGGSCLLASWKRRKSL